MNLEHDHFLVFGAARSGLAAARLLRALGKTVVVYDEAPPAQLSDAAARLSEAGVPLLFNADALLFPRSESSVQAASSGPASRWETLVLSPGIPPSHPLVQRARENGCRICSEIEIGYQVCPAPLLAVTGTNGKTTVTHLLSHLFEHAGYYAPAAGNVGNPLCAVACEPALRDAKAVVACEVSSYQLETILDFRPKAACVLNITPDHLDRYGTMELYAEAKRRITLNQTEDDFLVLNADDMLCLSFGMYTRARLHVFSLHHPVSRGAFLQDDTLFLAFGEDGQAVPVLPRSEIPLPGMHNVANVLAALAMGAALGLDPEGMRAAIRAFRAVPHRIEWVGKIHSADYYNDSKATNLDSLEKALLSFDRPIILIAGGRDKGAPWTRLNALVRERVRGLILIGEAAPIGKAAWGPLVEWTAEAADMADAVRKAGEAARPGEVVLLSPACASFDMYRNFEERGDHFRSLVQAMAENEIS